MGKRKRGANKGETCKSQLIDFDASGVGDVTEAGEDDETGQEAGAQIHSAGQHCVTVSTPNNNINNININNTMKLELITQHIQSSHFGSGSNVKREGVFIFIIVLIII